MPVIAGAGSNSTDEAIALTRHAKEVGATRFCRSPAITTSRRRKASIAISWRIAEAVDIPILLYNIPGRAIVEITRRDHGASVEASGTSSGVKDATANLMRPTRERMPAGRTGV